MTAMTWSDDEESGSEDEDKPKEVANLCLISQDDEDEVSTSNSSQITLNELQDIFDELMAEFKKMGIKNSLLKKMISTLSKENEDFLKENEDLKSEVYILKERLKKNSFSKDFSKKKANAK